MSEMEKRIVSKFKIVQRRNRKSKFMNGTINVSHDSQHQSSIDLKQVSRNSSLEPQSSLDNRNQPKLYLDSQLPPIIAKQFRGSQNTQIFQNKMNRFTRNLQSQILQQDVL